MRLAALAFLLGVLPIVQANPPAGPPAPTATAATDDQLLKNAHLDTTAPALLDFFHKRAAPVADRKRLLVLVQQLADGVPAQRDQAAGELIGWGPGAVPLLHQAANRVDDEQTSRRARACLEAIQGKTGSSLVQTAVRVLAQRHPPGMVDALLHYVPFADDEMVVQEIETALLGVDLHQGDACSTLIRTLTDPVPVRRGLAAHVLCRLGGAAERAAVRSLLKDPRPTVRLRAALGLIDTHDAEAIPVLIDLVGELPAEGRKQAENYLTELAGEWSVKTPSGNDATSGRLRRDVWATWWRSLDGVHLLDEFRSRTLSDDERKRVLGLIRQLDDGAANIRTRAMDELVALGPRAAPLLRQTVNHSPASASEAATQCLEAIEQNNPQPLPAVAPRLLALRRPEGTVEALLAYLPFADNEAIAAQVAGLLPAVGCPEVKPAPALLRAMHDPLAVRRAAAAVALCKAHATEQLPAVRKLLEDPDAAVRTKIALALVENGEKEAIPVLIAALAELPLEQVWEIEDRLTQLAGEKAPVQRLTADSAGRAAGVESWKKWWRTEGARLDTARLTNINRDLGLLLVIEQQSPPKNQGRVLELSPSGKIRWQIEGLQFPWDADVASNGNIVLLEQGIRVSERDRQGKVLWQVVTNNAFMCQRLRNGNTFILCRNQLLEVDAKGKEVFSHAYPQGYILGGRKFADGQMAFVTYQGWYVRLDATGKEVKTFNVPVNTNFGVSGADVVPGDHVVLATPGVGKVAEYGEGGKLIWETNVPNPGAPYRLPNGHTLVPSNHQTTITELDRTGKVVSEKKDLAFRPFRVRRR
jgi:HEAT repeat protein